MVAVTPAGEQVLRQAQQVVRRIQDDLLATLPEQDREVFLRALLATGERTTGQHLPVRAGGPLRLLVPRKIVPNKTICYGRTRSFPLNEEPS